MNYLGARAQYPYLFNYSKKRKEDPKHDYVTSKALSWMVNYCEVPRFVDITLQAIAGATRGLPLKPLQNCQAALKISQRLVSGSLYNSTTEHQRHIRLYLRALAVLTGARSQQELTVRTTSNTSELEHFKALIWELQSQNESSVASLMTETKFIPSNYDILTLRVGSNTALRCLEILEKHYSDTKALIVPFVRELEQLLEQARVHWLQVHPASMVALLNTGSMLSAFSVSCDDTTLLPNMCIQIFCDQFLPKIRADPSILQAESKAQMPRALISCCLLQNKHTARRQDSIQDILPVLIELRSLESLDLGGFISIGLLEILSDPESYAIAPTQIPNFGDARDQAKIGSRDIAPQFYDYPINPNQFDVCRSLTILRNVYTLAQAGSPSPWAYVYVVGSMSRVRSRYLAPPVANNVTDHCGYLLSRFCFPKLSLEFVESLEKCNLYKRLKRKDSSKSSNPVKHFLAASQLWLLYTLSLDPISCTNDDSTLILGRLRACFSIADDNEIEKAKHELGEKLEALSNDLSAGGFELGSFEVYYYRVLECVFQARDIPISDSRWERIQQKLTSVPPTLRGLGSFIQLPMRSPLAGTPPLPNHATIDVRSSRETDGIVDPEANSPSPELNTDPVTNYDSLGLD